jgi:uroporphyrinogen decarboxylase
MRERMPFRFLIPGLVFLAKWIFKGTHVQPVKRMVERINRERPGVPVIGFAKGAGALLENYREETGVNCVGLDWTVPASLARRIQKGGAVQGNLDPLRVDCRGRGAG